MEEHQAMEITVDNFGDICRRLRRKRKISQEEIASRIGVATSTIERIENKKVIPRLDSILSIFKILNEKITLSSDIQVRK